MSNKVRSFRHLFLLTTQSESQSHTFFRSQRLTISQEVCRLKPFGEWFLVRAVTGLVVNQWSNVGSRVTELTHNSCETSDAPLGKKHVELRVVIVLRNIVVWTLVRSAPEVRRVDFLPRNPSVTIVKIYPFNQKLHFWSSFVPICLNSIGITRGEHGVLSRASKCAIQ